MGARLARFPGAHAAVAAALCCGCSAGAPSGIDGSSGGDAGRSDAGAGVVVVLAAGQDHPGKLVVHQGYVYFANLGDGTSGGSLARVAATGGPVETLATGAVADLFVDDSAVYWTSSGDCPALDGTIPLDGSVQRTPLDGGATTVVAAGESCPTSITAQGGFVYWTRMTLGSGARTVSVVRAPSGGGAPAAFADCGYSLAVDSTSLYCYSPASGLLAVPLSGGPPAVLTADLLGPLPFGDLSTDANHLYWSTGNDPGAIAAISKTGTGASVLLDRSQLFLYPRDVSADAHDLYFVEQSTFTSDRFPSGVAKIALGGGAVTLVAGVQAPLRLALDESHVYWSDYGGGTIASASKD